MRKRNVGLDLLRICSMLSIIGLHVINHGGMLNAAATPVQDRIVHFMGSICYCSVNTFAMLTGYLYSQKKTVQSSNLIRLLVSVATYCVLIFLIFWVAEPHLFAENRKLIIYALLPAIAERYWFLTAYVLMFVMIPYINTLIHALSQIQFKRMLLLLFLLLSVLTTFASLDFFKISRGYSPFWLIFCYFVGAYINLYQTNAPDRRWRLLAIFGFNIVLVTVVWLHFKNGFLVKYVSPFMVVNAACLLRYFSQLELKSSWLNKIIYSLSNAAFGVYIIHSHILIFDYILQDMFINVNTMSNTKYCVILITSIVVIYAICWVIDSIRNYIFGRIHIDSLLKSIGRKIDAFLRWN